MRATSVRVRLRPCVPLRVPEVFVVGLHGDCSAFYRTLPVGVLGSLGHLPTRQDAVRV